MGTFNTGIYPASPGLSLGRVGQEWNGVLAAVSALGPLSGAFLNGFVQTAFSATPIFVPSNLNFSIFQITLTGDVTSSTIDTTGMQAGAVVIFEIIEDGVGAHSFAWPVEFQNPFAITAARAAANSVYVLPFFYDGTNFYSLTLNDLLGAFSRSTAPLTSGYVDINTGLVTESSIVINNGSLLITQDSAYVAVKNSGFFGNIQAGDPGSGDPAWLAENTFTLPRLSGVGATPQSGFLLAVTGAVAAAAPGNGLFLDSEFGVMNDSGIGMNQQISFPVSTRKIFWNNGAFSIALASAAATANRVVTIPDADGSFTLATGVPANSAAAGTAGQISYDASFFYICVATNTWRRVAIAAF